jgi:hypothetical protein
MNKIKKNDDNDFRNRYNLKNNRYTILIREEEFKANYVEAKIPIIYDVITELSQMDYNVVIMPRYEKEPLKQMFPKATILEDTLRPEEFYPFIDLLIGGGGTMNLEASYYGIPVISTRSFNLFHDKYLIDNKAMYWSHNTEEIIELVKNLIGKKMNNKDIFCKDECNFNKIVEIINRFL